MIQLSMQRSKENQSKAFPVGKEQPIVPSSDCMKKSAHELKRLTIPLGIRLIVMYAGLGVLATFPVGILLLLSGELTVAAVVMAAVLMVFGALFLAMIYGLLKLKWWAYKLAKVVYSILFVFGFIALVSNLTPANVVQQGIAISISTWILIYLRREHIKTLFELGHGR